MEECVLESKLSLESLKRLWQYLDTKEEKSRRVLNEDIKHILLRRSARVYVNKGREIFLITRDRNCDMQRIFEWIFNQTCPEPHKRNSSTLALLIYTSDFFNEDEICKRDGLWHESKMKRFMTVLDTFCPRLLESYRSELTAALLRRITFGELTELFTKWL